MKVFNDIITLNKNSRGCYILDTVKGCAICKTKPGGCYGDCYAKKIADRYNIDFLNPIKRQFKKTNQLDLFTGEHVKCSNHIISDILSCNMPFIRIGEMGDPSYFWEHTIDVCEEIQVAKKPIVIITKHWNKLTQDLLIRMSKLNIYINTSVSALDSNDEINYRLEQYEEIKKYVYSILRVITCKFNTNNILGAKLNRIQDTLLSYDNVLETTLRPSINNAFLVNGIIQVEKVKFLGTTMLASPRTNDYYIGRCDSCPDMCGLDKKFKDFRT